VMSVQRFIAGLHFIQFNHWPLRFLYFLCGLSGCVMIATGFLFWLESRRKRHVREALSGVRIVEGVTIGTVTGIIIATLVFFVGNRLLPPGMEIRGVARAELEMWAFYIAWLASFAHAWLRPRTAWRVQCQTIALLAVMAVILNAVTTGDNLLHTLTTGSWAVAGMDLALLAGAGIAVFAAHKLRHAAEQGSAGLPDRLVAPVK
jgi:hypothetical protein